MLSSTPPQLLNLRCDVSHDHTPCAWPNILLIEAYTPSIGELVHKSIAHDIAAASKRADVQTTAAAATAGLRYSGRLVLLVGIEEIEEPAAIVLQLPHWRLNLRGLALALRAQH